MVSRSMSSLPLTSLKKKGNAVLLGFLRLLYGWLGLLVFVGVLAACGGGGGNPGTGTGSAAPPPPAPVATPAMGIGLFNSAGAAITSLTDGSVTYVAVKLQTAAGTPISGIVVTFTAENPALVKLLPSTGTALTDKDGLANLQVAPAPGTAGGATYFNAAATVNGAAVTSPRLGATVSPAAPVVVTAPGMSVAVVSPTGTTVTNVLFGGGQLARAELKDGRGAAVPNRLVTFSAQPATLVSINPVTALTDQRGVATVSINPVSISVLGAARVEATAVVDGQPATGGFDFAVQAVSLALSPLRFGASTLASSAETSVSLDAFVGGNLAIGVPISVLFAASCGRVNEADAVRGLSVGTDGNSRAAVVYRAVALDGTPCRGRVNFSAVATGAPAQQGAVTVADPVANAVNFVGATPNQVFVAGSGAQEQSVVVFKALAGTTPLQDVAVRFTLATNPGGAGLASTGSAEPVVVSTNAAGEARVTVFSGSIPGPLKVRATLVSDPNTFSETQNLSVSSGPPSQRYMSLAVETFNIEGWNRDGTNTKLTVRLADRQGNPVENGTVVNFTTEGGQVQSSCATQINNGISACTVNFETQNPRPAGGRASVLAFVAGTKDYVDVNGNNRFDAGVDVLVDQGDVYRDDNENGRFDAGEFLVSRGGNLVCPSAGAPVPSRQATCDGSLSTIVRQQTLIMFGSSQPLLTVTNVATGGISFRISSRDNPLIPMPAGTVVSAEAIDNTPSNNLGCSVVKVFGTPIPNVSPGTDPQADLATSSSVALKDCAGGDSVVVTVRAPSGLESSFGIQIPVAPTPPAPVPIIPVADNITAATPSPSQIFVAGNGLQDDSSVVFQSRSGTTPVGSQTLRVSIVGNIGGIQLGSRGNTTPLTVVTDANGRATVAVYAGTIPTPVKLRAELASNPGVVTEVQSLVITSGPPSQRFFSVTVSNPNIEGMNIDGSRTTFNVLAADRQGNPVPNGTRVNFVAEGGQIASPCEMQQNNGISGCSVQYASQDPRPTNGRVSVLAYADGTKDYIDVNGNNRFDAGDVLTNIGDAYRDDNENNVFDPGEFVVRRNVGSVACSATSAPVPGVVNTCDDTLNTNVRKQLTILVLPSFSDVTLLSVTRVSTTSAVVSVRVNATGLPELPMPSGTRLTVSGIGQNCTSGTAAPPAVGLIFPTSDLAAQLGTVHDLEIACTQRAAGSVRLTVTAPSGSATSYAIPIPAAP